MKKRMLGIGFRNIKRNPRRTFITSLVIAIGCFSLILTDGFTAGFIQYLVESGTSDFYGQSRLRNPSFTEDPQAQYVINSPEKLIDKFSEATEIANTTKRTYSTALISSAEDNQNVQLVGLDFLAEPRVSKVKKHIVSGKFLSGEGGELIIGKELAKRLNVAIGERLVITTTKASDEQLTQELFRLSGIYSFANKAMDLNFAFINIKQSQDLLEIGNSVHEIILRFKHIESASKVKWSELAKENGVRYEDWQSFLAPLSATISMTRKSIMIVAFILAILIFFTVTNTLHMSLYERIFEFGVLRAIGTSKSNLFTMIMIESTALALIGILITGLLVASIGSYLAIYGVNYEGLSYNNISLREPILFLFSPFHIILYSLGTIIFVSLISLYPAWQILKISPAESLHSRN